MPSRKTTIIIRKYLIIFFAILLIFIWLNHDRAKDEKDDGMVHFPSVSIPPTTEKISTLFLQRQERLRALVSKKRLNLTKQILGREAIRHKTTRQTTAGAVFKDQNEAKEKVKPARYFVYSEKCKMPYADPFSREALEIYTPFKLKLCSNESDIFVLNYDWNKKHYMLHLNEEALYRLSPNLSIVCNFRKVIQGHNNSRE